MPLVVPGLTNNSGENDKTNNWMNQLMGKKIGDTSNETVSSLRSFAGMQGSPAAWEDR
jgi:hypothetical protein